MQRPVLAVGEEKHVICTVKDLSLVMSVLPQIEETTLTRLSGHVLDCFHNVITPLYKEQGAFDYAALTERYNQVFHRKRSSSTLRKYVMLLGQVGYVDTIPDPNDKRKSLMMVIKKLDENVFDSVIHKFSDSFALKKFKAWFDEIENSVLQNHVVPMYKLTSEHEADIETIYDEHYSPTLLHIEPTHFREQISQYASKPVEGVKPQKTIEDMFRTEKNRISDLDFSNIASIESLEKPYKDTCAVCRRKAVLYHQVKTFKGEWGHVCQDCGDAVTRRLSA